MIRGVLVMGTTVPMMLFRQLSNNKNLLSAETHRNHEMNFEQILESILILRLRVTRK